MIVQYFPAWLKEAIAQSGEFESWQILVAMFATLFVIALISGGIVAFFRRGSSNGPEEHSMREEDVVVTRAESRLEKQVPRSKKQGEPKKSKSDMTAMPGKSNWQDNDDDNPLRQPSVPEKIALVDDAEVTTHVEPPQDNPPPLPKKTPKQSSPIGSTEEAEQAMSELGAQMGRDRSDNVVMLFLNGKSVTEDHLAGLRHFRMLESLHLRRTKIGDAELDYILKLKRLKFLYITDTNVTDAGVQKLKAGNADLTIES